MVRQIRIRNSDIEDKRADPFMRHWIILSNLSQIKLGLDYEGHLARIFVYTGANCNTICRKFYSTLLGQRLKYAFYPGPPGGIDINLFGVKRLGVSGDKTTFMTEVKTTWGSFYSKQDFLILDQDGEDVVMGVIWFNLVMTA